jgi:hypothetical protein
VRTTAALHYTEYVTRFAVLFLFLSFRLILASSAADLAREISQVSLDPQECYRVMDLNFSKEDVKIYLARPAT